MGVRVVLVDSEVLFRGAVHALIDRAGGYEIVAEASDGQEALARIARHAPDLVVLETSLPRLAGSEVVRQAKAHGSQALFLFLSNRIGRRHVEEALRAGANGYVTKSDSATELLSAIEAVGSGQTYLSPSATRHLVEIALGRGDSENGRADLSSREREVLQLIAEGMSSKEIAEALHVSVRTVDSHRANLMDKLGIHKVSGLVRYAIREGLLNP
jgi:DNA-binding NarL/FixJ family response regulator